MKLVLNCATFSTPTHHAFRCKLSSTINMIAFCFLLVRHRPSADPLERNRQNTATLETSERRFLVDAIYLALCKPEWSGRFRRRVAAATTSRAVGAAAIGGD